MHTCLRTMDQSLDTMKMATITKHPNSFKTKIPHLRAQTYLTPTVIISSSVSGHAIWICPRIAYVHLRHQWGGNPLHECLKLTVDRWEWVGNLGKPLAAQANVFQQPGNTTDKWLVLVYILDRWTDGYLATELCYNHLIIYFLPKFLYGKSSCLSREKFVTK